MGTRGVNLPWWAAQHRSSCWEGNTEGRAKRVGVDGNRGHPDSRQVVQVRAGGVEENHCGSWGGGWGGQSLSLLCCYGKGRSVRPSPTTRVSSSSSEAEPQECEVLTSPQVTVLQTRFESHPSCLSRLAGVVGRSQTLRGDPQAGPHSERSLCRRLGWRKARIRGAE